MTNKKVLWIFDLDDTLFWNERCYSWAFRRFVNYMDDVFWDYSLPFDGEIAQRLGRISAEMVDEINPRTGKIWGYAQERFAEALARCYRWLCKSCGILPEQYTEQNVFRIGIDVGRPENYSKLGFAPGAAEVLDWLKACGDCLVLATRGDSHLQGLKIRTFQLGCWFEEFYIVQAKTSKFFQEIAETRSSDVAVSAGNSYKHDILPALEAGLWAVHIPAHTWKGDEHSGREEEHPRLITIRRIIEIKNIREKIGSS